MPQDTPRAIGLRQRLQNAGQPLQLSLNEMLRLYFLDGVLRRLEASAYHPVSYTHLTLPSILRV